MSALQIDLGKVYSFLQEKEIRGLQDDVTRHWQSLYDGTGKGSDFLGWVRLPSSITEEEAGNILVAADKLRKRSQVIVVVGIGGSYLGARAVIDALTDPFGGYLPDYQDPLVIYAGHHLGQDYHRALLRLLDRKDYSIVVISKSGTTTEPAIAFRLLKDHIERKYGLAEARQRIMAITDRHKGALKGLADREGYNSFVVPDDVGGRYSVLTPVGLLPIAAAGIDILELLHGAREMEMELQSSSSIDTNPAAAYAAARNALYRAGKTTEVMVTYEPGMAYFTEWWKQLYGESEGKEGKGIFPAGVSFTSDLHSMGQYIQDGQRHLFETVISVERSRDTLAIPQAPDDADGLNYLAGRELQHVNRMAGLGTLLAHVDGGVPNIRISIPMIDARSLGELIYFFELACGLSGYLLGVNPFDQPGVEAYKRNMFALLGKSGFEKEGEGLRARLD